MNATSGFVGETANLAGSFIGLKPSVSAQQEVFIVELERKTTIIFGVSLMPGFAGFVC
jgi:hypothetical protein